MALGGWSWWWWVCRGGRFNLNHCRSDPRSEDRGGTHRPHKIVLAPPQEPTLWLQAQSGCPSGRSIPRRPAWLSGALDSKPCRLRLRVGGSEGRSVEGSLRPHMISSLGALVVLPLYRNRRSGGGSGGKAFPITCKKNQCLIGAVIITKKLGDISRLLHGKNQ